MTARRVLLHLIGLAVVIALAYGFYAAWSAWRDIAGALPQPWRGFVNQTRFVVEILAAFLALSVVDWLWRQTLGRLSPPT